MTVRRPRGEGSVYLRKDGRWAGEYRDITGRRRWVYARDEATARRKLRGALNDRDQGVGGDRATLGAWLDRWVDTVTPPRYAETTAADYRYKAGLVPGWARRVRLDEFDPLDMERVLDELLHTHAPSTVAQVRSVVRRSLSVAQRYGLVSRNVAALVDPPKVEPSDVAPLTLDEARAFLAAVEGHRLESLYTVALSHGVRESEAIGLRWTEVDLDAGQIAVVTQLVRTNAGKVVRRKPKTRGSRRRIDLTGLGVDRLREHRARQAAERLELGAAWEDVGLVWPSKVGTPLAHRNLLRHVYRTCERAGIRRVNFHTLRHSAATLMLAQGIPERVIMGVLGHTDMRMVARYQHVTDTLSRQAADAMDGLFR